jgi:hypothetical protein
MQNPSRCQRAVLTFPQGLAAGHILLQSAIIISFVNDTCVLVGPLHDNNQGEHIMMDKRNSSSKRPTRLRNALHFISVVVKRCWSCQSLTGQHILLWVHDYRFSYTALSTNDHARDSLNTVYPHQNDTVGSWHKSPLYVQQCFADRE